MSATNPQTPTPAPLAARSCSADELLGRIRHYLCSGGLFNPELANHIAVRDLILDCRDWIERAWQPPAATASPPEGRPILRQGGLPPPWSPNASPPATPNAGVVMEAERNEGLAARAGSATYRVEERRSPASMGIQRRIVGPRHIGPWTGGGTTADAWRGYKASRRKSPNASPPATAQEERS
jgi:hypothetical protein